MKTNPIRFYGDGPPVSFLHANGFPPAAYAPFLRALSRDLDVTAFPLRPLTGARPNAAIEWSDLGRDLVTQTRPGTIAIGHSLGATAAIMAAAEFPSHFAALALIEPAMLGRWLSVGLRAMPYAVRRRIGPAAKASVKRDHWPDPQAFLDSCKRSGLYDRVSEQGMRIFADAALREVDNGVTLTFPRAWEAHLYTNAPWPVPEFSRLIVPVVGLRGQSSPFLDDIRWRDLTSRQPTGWFRQLPDSGHLLPLEQPELAAEMVVEGLRALGVLPSRN